MGKSISNIFRSLAARRSQGSSTQTRPLYSQSSNDSRCVTAAAVVAIIGIGYVGLSLVKIFCPHYRVIAFDISTERIWNLRKEWDHLDNVEWTTDAARIYEATHILLAVPTSLRHHDIDSAGLKQAVRTVRRHARPGSTVIIESSVPVGMTRELLVSVMEDRCLKGGISPEVSCFCSSLRPYKLMVRGISGPTPEESPEKCKTFLSS